MADITVRATYRNGTLELLDPVRLKDGDTFTVTLHSDEADAVERRAEIVRKSFGAWKGLIDPEEFKRYLRESRELPAEPAPQL